VFLLIDFLQRRVDASVLMVGLVGHVRKLKPVVDVMSAGTGIEWRQSVLL